MNKYQIIKEIIYLPSRYNKPSNNSSMYLLLKNSGYFKEHNIIHENDIQKLLNDYPECIENWITLSEDKRTDAGWYFSQNNSGKYIVAYFAKNGISNSTEYEDKTKACAAFIKLEIEDIRNTLKQLNFLQRIFLFLGGRI